MRRITSLEDIPETALGIAARYRGLTFRWERWRQTDPEWDHDHCFFCEVCICDSRTKGYYGEAFVVRHEGDSPFWVCRLCFKLARWVLDWHMDRTNP